MSTVISRTDAGKGLLQIAQETGLIKVEEKVNVRAIERLGRLKLKRKSL